MSSAVSYSHKGISLRQVVLTLLGVFFSIQLAAEPDFPAPPKASVEWVGKNMQLNGIRSDIRAFHSKKSLEKIADFYRKEWQEPVDGGDKDEQLPGYTETGAMAPWYLLTRIEDGYLMTVQIQEADRGGSWGYLAISPLPDKDLQIEPGKNIPKMRGSSVLSELKTEDLGQKGRTLIVSNEHSIASNVSFYRNHYQGKGWSTDIDREVSRGKMHTLVFKSRRKRINIMFIGDHNSTRIVINAVTHSIL